jgi:hypothetical protein
MASIPSKRWKSFVMNCFNPSSFISVWQSAMKIMQAKDYFEPFGKLDATAAFGLVELKE